MRIFVATRRVDVPDGLVHYASVDGSVPGAAVTWDHHRTGEGINLDAMPDVFDPTGFDGVGTTLADADAAASVVAFLMGGRSRLPAATRAVLESASHWCDHLAPHPAHDSATNALGRGLREHLDAALGLKEARARNFESVCKQLHAVVASGGPLPFREVDPRVDEAARALVTSGRLHGTEAVALLDLTGGLSVDPLATYSLHRAPVSVLVDDHPKGGVRYTVGTNPYVDPRPTDLGPALRALAVAEFAYGPPCLAPEPVPGSENWGGRATVFGSPWNFGSRLSADEVVHIVQSALGLNSAG